MDELHGIREALRGEMRGWEALQELGILVMDANGTMRSVCDVEADARAALLLVEDEDRREKLHDVLFVGLE